MLPVAGTNYDIGVQSSATPSVDMAYNLGQKDLRYLNDHAEYMTYSEIGFQRDESFIEAFSGSCNELRDKPEWAALVS